MYETIKKFVDAHKYLVLLSVFAIAFFVNFTIVKQERNAYENTINQLAVTAETLREQAKIDPSAKSVVIQVESQITQEKNNSMWINITYVAFLGIIATIMLVILATFAQWGYTHVPFAMKLLNPDGKNDSSDVSMYATVLSAIYIGEAIVIAVIVFAVFGG